MKKIAALIMIALILSVSALCACGSDKEKNSTPDEAAKSSQSASEKASQPAVSGSSKDVEKSTEASGKKSDKKSDAAAADDEGELPLVKADSGEGAIADDDSSDSSGNNNSGSGSSGSGGNSSSGNSNKATESTVNWDDIVKEGEEYGDELPFVPAY